MPPGYTFLAGAIHPFGGTGGRHGELYFSSVTVLVTGSSCEQQATIRRSAIFAAGRVSTHCPAGQVG